MQKKQLNEAGQAFDSMLYHIFKQHPLNHEYGYTFRDSYFVNVPKSADAMIKHPPRIICTGPVHMEGGDISLAGSDIADYAYRHQLKLTMNVKDAKKLLGDSEEAQPFETKQYIGKRIIAQS